MPYTTAHASLDFPRNRYDCPEPAVCLPSWRLAAEAQDARFKVDLLLVVAHPDDDVLAGTYFAKLLDEGKRIAVVFMTSGESGGNAAGVERATSLGLIRQTEARNDLSSIGISTVWFLTGRDTAGQDPRRSLAVWGHGRILADTVRIVRLTRPEVILTWLPLQVAGENHGDHQAASVVATEAFDAAGDAVAIPRAVGGTREAVRIRVRRPRGVAAEEAVLHVGCDGHARS